MYRFNLTSALPGTKIQLYKIYQNRIIVQKQFVQDAA
jgi:hypothetical protein